MLAGTPTGSIADGQPGIRLWLYTLLYLVLVSITQSFLW